MLTAIVGINWGDEGKGRMVDLLGSRYDIVVRYQGGNNAGHTVVNEEEIHTESASIGNPAGWNRKRHGTGHGHRPCPSLQKNQRIAEKGIE